MVSSFTPNKSLTQPARGDLVGTWDTPVNGNMGIIDNSFGGIANIALTNSPVTLSSGQYQCAFINLTGAITANCNLVFPSGIGSFFTMLNNTTNSSAFVVSMSVSGGPNTIGLPPGANTKVLIDGTNPQYAALPHHIGEYWLHAGSSVPLWVTICTIDPYLNCDGTTFSSATYPNLTSLIGSTTLPDMRGRGLFPLDQGTGRNGLAAYQSSGVATVTLGSSNIPAHNHPISDTGHTHNVNVNTTTQNINAPGTGFLGQIGTYATTANGTNSVMNASATTGITVSNSTYANSAFSNLPPAIAHGITMVRAG